MPGLPILDQAKVGELQFLCVSVRIPIVDYSLCGAQQESSLFIDLRHHQRVTRRVRVGLGPGYVAKPVGLAGQRAAHETGDRRR